MIVPPLVNPCDLPGADLVCDVAGDVVGGVAGAAGDFVMRGVTVWVTNAAVWVTGKVGDLIDATASPDVTAEWFRGQYRSMLSVAGVLALPMLLLAAIQALMRQDLWILLRSAFGYLPMAFILAGAAIVGTDLLISITDDLSAMVTASLGDGSDNLLESVGDAYSGAIEDDSAEVVPLFGVFLGAIILAIGAFVLWLEMVIRDAAIYIAVFFLPLTFIAMIWPATSRYAKRLVEFLIAVILAKFVIVAIIGLASAATHERRSARRGAGLRAHDRRRGSARSRRLVALRPAATHPDDGDRGRERRQPALLDVRRGSVGRHLDAGHVHAPGDGSPLAGVSLARLAGRGRHDLQPRRVERRPILGSRRRSRRTRREPSRAKRGRADPARPPERRAGRPTRRHGRAPRQTRIPRREHPPPPALHGRRLHRSHREMRAHRTRSADRWRRTLAAIASDRSSGAG